MIYVHGDPHGDFARILEFSRGEIGKQMTKDDFVIILGDLNVCKETLERIRNLAQLPFTVLFLDGNHECFPMLEAMPTVSMYGGRVHDLGGVYHLQRGEIFRLPSAAQPSNAPSPIVFTLSGRISSVKAGQDEKASSRISTRP